jgi:hypothetical protein
MYFLWIPNRQDSWVGHLQTPSKISIVGLEIDTEATLIETNCKSVLAWNRHQGPSSPPVGMIKGRHFLVRGGIPDATFAIFCCRYK